MPRISDERLAEWIAGKGNWGTSAGELLDALIAEREYAKACEEVCEAAVVVRNQLSQFGELSGSTQDNFELVVAEWEATPMTLTEKLAALRELRYPLDDQAALFALIDVVEAAAEIREQYGSEYDPIAQRILAALDRLEEVL